MRLASLSLLLAALGYCAATFLNGNAAVASVKAEAVDTLLAPLIEEKAPGTATLDQATLRSAIVAEPLNPAVINGAVYLAAQGSGEAMLPKPELEVLGKLGWRSTPALQNLIYAAAKQQKLGQIADIADALLRRQDIVPQATALMNLMELAPQIQATVIEKLAANPEWRVGYLANVNGLASRQQIDARYDVIQGLDKKGQKLTRQELQPNLLQMTKLGAYDQAYAAWRQNLRMPALPLNDPDFRQALLLREDGSELIPFEWFLVPASGAWSEIEPDGKGGAVTVHWDGKGVPDFMRQRVVLDRDRYQLVVNGRQLDQRAMSRISFTLRCPAQTVYFRPVTERLNGRDLTLVMDDDVPCKSPYFYVSGRPPSSLSSDLEPFGMARDIEFVLTRLDLRPVSGGIATRRPTASEGAVPRVR